jgi:hypothetical protein
MSDLTIIKHEDISFLPSSYQQELKAQFFSRFEPGPFRDTNTITLADAQAVLKEPKLKQYWGIPGFREWFTNKNEVAEKIEYLTLVGLDALEAVLLDPKSQASAKVNAFKLLAEIKGMVNRGGKKEEKKSAVDEMSEAELKEYLNKYGVGR